MAILDPAPACLPCGCIPGVLNCSKATRIWQAARKAKDLAYKEGHLLALWNKYHQLLQDYLEHQEAQEASMPIYEYQCVDCKARDQRVAGLDDHTALCTSCGSLMLRTNADIFSAYFEAAKPTVHNFSSITPEPRRT